MINLHHPDGRGRSSFTMTRTTLQLRSSWGYLFTMAHILIISRAIPSDSTDSYSFCTALEDCIGRCSTSSLSHVSCRNESFPCDCGDVKCFLFKGVCVSHCGPPVSVSEECYDCFFVHENSDICLESCPDSRICVASDCWNSSKLCQQCLPGYHGVDCQRKCSDTCDGSCYRGNGYCSQCEMGSFGQSCELSCPLNCYRNSCLAETGHCQRCSSGYRGPTCSDSCARGFYGHSCRKRCSPHCEEKQCDPISGQCVLGCEPGYFNIRCEQECPSGTYGEDCLAQCPVTCSGGSLCDPVNGTCLLGCTAGFQGDHCNVLCQAGTFGENCASNCSDNCFLRACNSFSGHCERCIWERDGPFCDNIKVEEQKERGIFYSDLTSDQILLTFLTLFAAGGALWFLMALSMYHRRKLVWEKIWKTGKIPYRHRLPKAFKEFLERSAKPAAYRYSPLGRDDVQRHVHPRRASPRPRRKTQEGRRLKKSLRFRRGLQSDSSAETLGEIDETQAFTRGLDLERDASALKAEPKDDVTSVKDTGAAGSVGDRLESPDSQKEDGRGENLVFTVPEEAIEGPHYYAIKHTVSPLSLDISQIPSRGSQDSLTNFRTENFVGSGSVFSSTPQYTSERRSDRVTKLLKKTTRTRSSPRVGMIPDTRHSLSTEGTTTSTHYIASGGRQGRSTEDVETETETDVTSRDTVTETSRDTAMETSRNTSSGSTSETDTETVSQEEEYSEESTEEISYASSSWTKTSTARRPPYSKSQEMKPMFPKVPINIPVQNMSQKVAAPQIWTTNTPSAMPLKPPPIPVRQTGILQKSYAYLSSIWPVKVGHAEKKPILKNPPSPRPPQRRYMSYRFMLTRLEEWRRSRGYQHDVRDGVFEVKDEASKKMSSSAVTTESTVAPSEMSGQGETTAQTTSYTMGSDTTSGIASSTLAALSTWKTSETMAEGPDRTSSGYYIDVNSSYPTHRRRGSLDMRPQLDTSEITSETSTLGTVAKGSSSAFRDASFVTRSDTYDTKSSRPSSGRSLTATSNGGSCFVYTTTETRSTSRDYSKYHTDESNYQTRSSRHPTHNTHTSATGARDVLSSGRPPRGQLSIHRKKMEQLREFNRNSHGHDVVPPGCTSSVRSSGRARIKSSRSGSMDTSTLFTTPSSATPTSLRSDCQSTLLETSTITSTTDISMTE